ncbi:SMP-30/gluconolactonase/LRE family protein [Glaciecola petra]|uniref:SMP-30/gluconolactonase/LRE family protein n=1 Tax=Glaciecola petra TaxID=3075602 RepID=A0ABU2ZQQ2_9ALTE|nr:SMP-30/gluconolactonase/LRE family protein [Aestuariibacter sp. P117]MDT0594960.1 SMP-30/gluconolactonase/LRE family protein [Aestuariibacter sp. P117]
MTQMNPKFIVAVAEQLSFVSAFLGGVSATILVTIVVFTASKKSVSWIVASSALAACSLLVAVIASWRLIILLHPEMPRLTDTGLVETLWKGMLLGYGIGFFSLLVSIGLTGWLRSKRAGMITSTIAVIAVLFFMLATPFGLRAETPSKLVQDGAKLNLVSDMFSFTEGPAVNKSGDVFFTDQPNDRIMKWSALDNTVSVFMQPAGRANGLYFDHDDNLLACADEQNELWKIDLNGEKTVLVDQFNSKRLNGPNDLWLDAKGGIYFTDPFYQRLYWQHEEQEITEQNVYYISPDSTSIVIAASELVKPNGIIGSADGKSLFVADIGADKTYKYDIGENGKLSNRRLFTELGSDGMTIDQQGNLYLTGNGVTVFNPQGKKVLHIPVPEDWTANVTFGGLNQRTLFITAMDSVYTLQMNSNGVR